MAKKQKDMLGVDENTETAIEITRFKEEVRSVLDLTKLINCLEELVFVCKNIMEG